MENDARSRRAPRGDAGTLMEAEAEAGETASHFPEGAAVPDALLWEALPDLKLNIAQTAALCGISVRQLGYWTKQGYVSATGRGSRRLYGLESLRRILAIRKAMGEGASLRQSLRALETMPAAHPGGSAGNGASPAPQNADRPEDGGDDRTEALDPDEVQVLRQCLLSLFNDNRRTRDDAQGLATKLGRSEEDVRAVAEQLFVSGALTKTAAHGGAVYQRAGEALL